MTEGGDVLREMVYAMYAWDLVTTTGGENAMQLCNHLPAS
jgi:hypothetical protein